MRGIGRFGLAAALCLCCLAAGAQPRSVWLIAVPGLRVADIGAPGLAPLRALVATGAWGWMNTRGSTCRGQSVESDAAAWATMGAGARSAAPDAVSDIGPAAAKRVLAATAGLDHPARIGQLGELLARAGHRLVVAGDADDDRPHREAGWLLCRGDGTVDEWREAGAALPGAAWGRAADGSLMVPRPGEQCLMSLFGDLSRARSELPLCRAPLRAAIMAQARARLGDLCRRAGSWVHGDRGRLLIVISVASGDDIRAGNRLAPILVAGEGYRGRLQSASTRTPGLVLSVDVVPTVSRWMGLGKTEGYGRPISSDGSCAGADEWVSGWSAWTRQTVLKERLGGFPAVTAMLLLALALVPGGWRRVRLTVAGGLVALPVAQWLGALLGPVSVPLGAAWLAALVVAYSFLVGWGSARNRGLVLATCGLVVVAAMVDLAGAQVLAKGSWLGYTVMEASRYYGIGNETAGVAIAAAVVFAGAMRRMAAPGETALVLFLASFALVLGAPGMGAALGEVLAAGIVFTMLVGRRLSLPLGGVAVVAGGVAAALLAAVIALDHLRGGGESHIGLAFANLPILAGTVARKMLINVRLGATSPWTLTAVAGVVCCLRLCKQASGARACALLRMVALAAGALLVLNDSGMMAGAVALAFGAACAALLADSDPLDKGPVQEHTDRYKAPVPDGSVA